MAKVEKLIKPTTDVTMFSTPPEVAAPTTSDVSSPGTGSNQDVVPIVASTSIAVVAAPINNAGIHSSKDVVAVNDDSVVEPDSKKRKVDDDHVNEGVR